MDWARQTKSERWRWEAAKLRARAALVEDRGMREQLLIFAEDCEEEARTRESMETAWRRA
jgi:hypothetical protein